MKIPGAEHALISREKVIRYLLNPDHPEVIRLYGAVHGTAHGEFTWHGDYGFHIKLTSVPMELAIRIAELVKASHDAGEMVPHHKQKMWEKGAAD